MGVFAMGDSATEAALTPHSIRAFCGPNLVYQQGMKITVICAVCKLIRVNGEWVRQEPAPNADLSHTYCPACFEVAMGQVAALSAKAGS